MAFENILGRVLIDFPDCLLNGTTAAADHPTVASHFRKFKLGYWQENGHNHGQHTQWDVRVYNALDAPKAKEWSKLKRFIHVYRTCYDTKKMTTSYADRFYITDLASTDVSLYAKGIRGH